MRQISLGMGLIALFLAACSTPEPVRIAAATEVPTEPPTATLVPTSTNTPTATNTPSPTDTPTHTPTPVPTDTPEPTLTPTPLPTADPVLLASCQLPLSQRRGGNVGLGIPKIDGLLPSVGTVNATVLFADFENEPAERDPESVFRIVDPIAPDIFRAFSYGKLELNLQPHFEWLRLSQPSGYYQNAISSGTGHREFIQEAVNLADEAVDFSNSDTIIVLSNPDAAAIRYGPAFVSLNANDQVRADGVSINTGTTSGYDLNGWGGAWLNHELGHTLSLPDLYDYTHGDHRHVGSFSLMGLISGSAPEFFAFERWMLGWLDDDQIYCHTAGEATVDVGAIEHPNGFKAIMVPTGPRSAVVIESRRRLGYDFGLIKEGALVYAVDTDINSGNGAIKVLTPIEDDPWFDQAPLAEGESFTVDNITITVLEARRDGDTIQVTVE